MRLPQLSLRGVLLLITGALTLMIFLLSAYDVITNTRRLSELHALRDASALGDELFSAADQLSLERDIAVTMLDAADPATVAELQPRLLESRRAADAALNAGMTALTRYEFPELAAARDGIQARYSSIRRLRPRIDRALRQSPGARPRGLTALWSGEVTQLTTETEALWLRFMGHFLDIEPVVTQHLRFKHMLRTILEYSGRERALIGRLVARGAAPTPDEASQLLRGQGVVEMSWRLSRFLSEQSGLDEHVGPRLRDAESHYATLQGMLHESFYVPGARRRTVYLISPDLWFELAAQSEESMEALNQAAIGATRAYLDRLIAEAGRAILAQAAVMLVALLLCALSIWVVLARVIRPINTMVDALVRAAHGERVDFTPSLREDELGKLGGVLSAYQQAAEEVRRTAGDLNRSETRLRAVVDHAVDGLITINSAGIIQSFNPACERAFGYAAEEVVGRNIKILMPEPYHSMHDDYLARYMTTGEARIIGTAGRELSARRKDGAVFPIDLSISAYELEDGKYFSGIIRDITARQEAETRLRAVVDHAVDGLITIDSKGLIQTFNPASERLFGYTAEEVVGRNIKMLMPEPYRGEHDHYVARYIQTNEPHIIGTAGREVSAQRKDGSVFPMDLSICSFKLRDGVYFSGIIRDATARKEAEARLKAVVDHAVDGLITINSAGIVQSFNPACERLFGYAAEEVIGRNIKMLMPEPYRGEHDHYVARYMETKEPHIIGTAGREVSAQRKDGSVFPMDLSICSFKLRDGVYFSGIIRDSSRRKAAEQALIEHAQALERSNKELDDFAYIASHDLKEPLRGIHNHSRFLLEDNADKLDEESAKRLGRLVELSQRMERLVNDLLYFSRLGRQELAIQLTDVAALIHDIEGTLDHFLEERAAKLTIATDLPLVTCDKPRVTELFRNLITNAAKYNDRPDKTIEVGFLPHKTNPAGEAVRNVFYVKDNGVGVAPEFHQEIFRIFRRLTPGKRAEEGTGVGLTFVKKIVERHGGRIWLESEVGAGAAFFFTLEPTQDEREREQRAA